MKKLIAVLSAGALALSMTACGGGGGAAGPAQQLNSVNYPKAVDYDDWDGKNAKASEFATDESFADSLSTFSARTSESLILSADGENLCYSPVSLYFALALAACGAEGETAEQLYSAMGVADRDALSEQCRNLFNLLYTDDGLNSLLLANSLWVNQEYELKDEYLKTAADDFYASVFNADFSDAATARQMTDWVSDNTKGLLKPDVKVDSDELLHLFNTVYFFSQWQEQFDSSQVSSDVFTTASGRISDADFMHAVDFGAYSVGKTPTGVEYTVASRALKSGSMVFILPDEGASVADVIDMSNSTVDISEPVLKTVIDGLGERSGEINWSIPKFKTDSTLDLVPMLESLGIETAFTGAADFSGMSEQPSMISAISQGTHIAVDETGVEAAAYTEITMDCTSAFAESDPIEMNLNRPFLYAVLSDDGTVLFTGVCNTIE